MKKPETPRPVRAAGVRALVVDDDPDICALLQGVLQDWGMEVRTVLSPLEVEGILDQDDSYGLVLLDVHMPEMSGLKLIQTIRRCRPGIKILVITGHADKQSVLRALRGGAFDFIEKPFDIEMLSHSVERAVESRRAERERRQALVELRQSREDLFRKAQQLRRSNKELQDANTALSVLAHNIERSREESEQEIVKRLRQLVQPLRDRLSIDRSFGAYRGEMTTLIEYIEELAAGLPEDLRISSTLSLSEYRIATLIKRGLTSQDIAEQLNISPATVKTHRRNIRRKLELSGTGSNLQTHLQALEGGR